MTKNNCNTKNRTFTHLTDIQRGKLEQMAKIGTYCVLQDFPTQYCKEKVHTFAPEIFL